MLLFSEAGRRVAWARVPRRSHAMRIFLGRNRQFMSKLIGTA
jgi:hypothetical protein